MTQGTLQGSRPIIISTEQIQKRVREMARQISSDYQGKTIQAVTVLENGFIFAADLVRSIEVSVVCQFIKPRYRSPRAEQANGMLEIFFSHELAIQDQHLLVVEGILHSGVTTEFLMNDLRGRGAASVKLATLLDRTSARRVPLQPDYFGFLVDRAFLAGYGLSSASQTERNLPYLTTSTSPAG